MSERARIGAFVAAALVTLAAWVALTVAGSEAERGPSSRDGAVGASPVATPSGASSSSAAPPGARATVVGAPAGSAAAGVAPRAALAVARRYAREYGAQHGGARVVRVVAADDPATAALELAATLRRGARETKVVLSLQATAGRWWVATAR